jgi:D-alanyl-D-alanine carboxypeptidase
LLGGFCLALAATQAPSASEAAVPQPAPGGAAAPGGPSVSPDLYKKRLQAMLNMANMKLSSPGMAMGVQIGTGPAWLFSTGTRNVATFEPMRTDEKFRIGSITKHFIALCAVQLVGEGKLALTDTVEKWLPGVLKKLDGKKITVESLLNHTAGIPTYSNEEAVLKKSYRTPPGYQFNAPTELITVAESLHGKPNQPVLGRFDYSNTNYILLAMIATKADGIPGYDWPRMVKKRIFDPVGMSNTSVPHPSDPTIPGGQQHGYINWKNFLTGSGFDCTKWTPPCQDTTTDFTLQHMSGPWSAGAIISTAGDLLKLLNAEMRGNLLTPAMRTKMHSTAFIDAQDQHRPGLEVGLGIFREPKFDTTFLGHFGGISGFNATLQYEQRADLSIVILSNRSPYNGVSVSGLPEKAYKALVLVPPDQEIFWDMEFYVAYDGSPGPTSGKPAFMQEY